MARCIPPSTVEKAKDSNIQPRKKISQLLKSVISLVLCAAMFVSFVSPEIVWAASATTQNNTVVSETEPYEKSILFEDISLRQQNKKTYRMSDGSYKAVVYSEPVHYENDGQWQDINNTLALDENSGNYVNAANDFCITFAKKSSSKKLVEVKTDDFKISWGFVGSSKNKSAQKKLRVSSNDIMKLENLSDSIRYENILPNVDAEYILSSKTLKENIILKNKNAQRTFELEMKLNNATAVLNSDRSISIISNDGTEAALIAAPYMYDAVGEKNDDIAVTLSQSGNKYTMILTPSEDWLASENRVFPVTIDPIITPTPSVQNISSVNMQDEVSRSGLYVGRFYNQSLSSSDLAYGFIGMTMPFDPSQDIVQKVTVSLDAAARGSNMWNGSVYNGVTINKTIGIHSVSEPFYTSAQQSAATIGDMLDAATISLDYSTEEELNTYNFDITEYFYDGYDHTKINYLMLKEYNAADTASAGMLPACFTNFRIEYDYRSPKGIEEYLTYTEASLGNSGTIYLGDAIGNLVYTRHLLTTYGDVAPITVGMIYEDGSWRTNLNQTLTKFIANGTSTAYEAELAAHGYPYMWIDGDGTEIYFHKTYACDENGNETTTVAAIEDETGKRITLRELSNGNIILVDTENVTSTFQPYSGNKYRLYKITDEFENTITINYTSNTSADISNITNNFEEGVWFTYTNGKLTEVLSENNTFGYMQTVTITYDTNGNLYSITDDTTTETVYGYTNGKLDRVLDRKSCYMVKVTTDGNKKTLQEYAEVTKDMSTEEVSPGQMIEITYNGTHTSFRTLGINGVMSDAQNSDDILTVYQFDNYLRTVSAYSKSYVGNTFYGAEQQEYTSGGLVFNSNTGKAENSAEKFGFNKIKNMVTTGDSTKNLLSNGSFENSLPTEQNAPYDFCGAIFECNEAILGGNGATLSDYVTTSILPADENTPVLSGNKALKATLSDQGAELRSAWYAPIAHTNSLSANTEYTFSAYVKSSNLNAQNIRLVAKIGATEYASDKAITTTVNEDWRRLEFRFTTPLSFTDEVKLCLEIAAAGTVFVDCVALEKGGAANAINYIENQGFENADSVSTAVWQRNNLTDADTTVDDTFFGSKAFKINGSLSAAKSITQYVPIENAAAASQPRDFTISAWSKADALPTNEDATGRFFGIRAQLVYYDGETGTNTYSELSETAFNTRQEDWQFASLSLSSEKDKILVGVNVTLAFEGQCGTCLFDNVSIEDNTVTNYEYDSLGNVVRIKVGNESETVNSYDKTKLENTTTVDLNDDTVESSTINQYVYDTSAVSHTIDADATFYVDSNGEKHYDRITSVDKINSVSYTAYDKWGRTAYTQTGTELLAGYTFTALSREDISRNDYEAYFSNAIVRSYPEYDLSQAVYLDGDGYIEVPNINTGDYFTISLRAYAPACGISTLFAKYNSNGDEVISIRTDGETCWIGGLGDGDYCFYGLNFNSTSADIAFTFEKVGDFYTRVTGYCDGLMDASYVIPTDVVYDHTDSSWYFGSGMDEDGYRVSGYSGYIDNIAIFRGALSECEIIKLNDDGITTAFDLNEVAEWTYYDYGQDELFVQYESNSDGSSVSYTYTDDQIESVTTTDRNNTTTRINYLYYNNKSLAKVYHDSNRDGILNSGEKYNAYSYDGYGNITSIEHNGVRYVFEYNDFGQIVTTFISERIVSCYGYAWERWGGVGNGVLISRDNVNYFYDKLGNVVGRKKGNTYIQKWKYDKLGNLVFENDLEDSTQTSYQYDAQSRLTQRTASLLGGNRFTTQYLYNSDSNITESAYNLSGTNLNLTFSDLYSYDNDGKFTLSDSGSTRTQTAYDEDNDSVTSRTVSVKGASGNYSTIASESYTYCDENDMGEIKDAVYEISYGANNKLQYEYYANGNIEVEYKNDEISKVYNYDSLGQLTEAYLYDGSAINEMLSRFGIDNTDLLVDYVKFNYTYNSGNNMTSYSAVLYDLDGAETTIYSKTIPYNGGLCSDQISDYDEETYEYYYEYDGMGNLSWNESYEYSWENDRELTSITDKSTQEAVASFEYDSSGLRISKTTSQSGTVYYVYDENSNLIFERHSDYILAFHYDGNGIRTHFDYITDSVTSTYYYRYNLQGDIIALLNSSGTVVEEYEYDPYGIQLTTASGIGAINPFRYRGYYYDSETGYYYLQSRYYDPTICRFINADDISFLGASGTLLGLNLYIYCENDPINNVDSFGCLPRRIITQKKTYISAAPKPTRRSEGLNAIASSRLWEKKYTVSVGYKAGTGINYDCFTYRTPKRKFLWFTYYEEVRYYVLTKTRKEWQAYCGKKFGWYYDFVYGLDVATESTVIDTIFNGNLYVSFGVTIATSLLKRMPKEMKYIINCLDKASNKKDLIAIPFGKRMYSYSGITRKYSMFNEVWLWR